MLLRYFVVVAISGLVTLFVYKNNIQIDYNDVKEILSALLNISSIIFAIIGAWIAIIYPKAMSRVFDPNNSVKLVEEANSDSKYLAELVEIVLVSACVLMSVLIIQFAYPVIKKSQCLPNIIVVCKTGGFFFITALVFLQLNAVFRVVLANYFFLNELNKKNNTAKVDLMHK